MANFSGTGVAVLTPFDEDYHVNSQELVRLLEHILAGGVEYLVALGTTAETPTLSAKEQLEVLDVFFSTVGDRIPVVIGAGGNNTAQVGKTIQDWTHRYQPSGFLSVCPYYNNPSQEGLYRHFRELSFHTDLPIILYNVPSRTRINMKAETTLRLAEEFNNICAIKESSGDMGQCGEILSHKPADFQVLSGDDSLALPLGALGAEGLISVLANAFPKPVSDMVRASLAGRQKEAQSTFYRLADLMKVCFEEGNPAGIKAVCQELGLCSANVRLPLVKASAALSHRIQEELARYVAPTSSSNSSVQ
ncbi:MAG: 4-hydroxy-tetrahydrodipicolinate synthase [Bacteroidota bacterium]